jgi:hypothetical protein
VGLLQHYFFAKSTLYYVFFCLNIRDQRGLAVLFHFYIEITYVCGDHIATQDLREPARLPYRQKALIILDMRNSRIAQEYSVAGNRETSESSASPP